MYLQNGDLDLGEARGRKGLTTYDQTYMTTYTNALCYNHLWKAIVQYLRTFINLWKEIHEPHKRVFKCSCGIKFGKNLRAHLKVVTS